MMNIEPWRALSALMQELARHLDFTPWPVAGLLVALGASWTAHQAFCRRVQAQDPGSGSGRIGLALARRLAWPLLAGLSGTLAWLLLWIAREPAALLQLFVLLACGLAATRLLLWALGWAVARERASRADYPEAERLAGWVVWLLLALQGLGWLAPTARAIDTIAIPVGNGQVSLLDGAKAVVVLVLFATAASYLGSFLERRLLAMAQVPIGIRVGVAKFARVLIVLVFMLIALNSLGLNLTTLAVLGGALGVGLGFGLQRIASNFVSGFILLGDRSIRPGDVITIGSRFGVVRELRARYVVVRDRDGVDTLIPNENIITSEVVNWSYADRHIRLKLPVQVGYDCNPREAMALMEGAARAHPRVESQPAPAARITGFGESGIDLELRFWIDDPEDGVMNVRSDLFLAIWDAFKEAHITIPYPQRELRLRGDGNAGQPFVVPGKAGSGE